MTEPREPSVRSEPEWGVAGIEQPWAVGEAIGAGWLGLMRNPIAMVGSYLIAIGVSAGLGFLARAVARALHVAPEHWPWVLVSGGVLGYVVQAFLQGGITKIWIAAARGERARLGMLASGIRFFPQMLLFSLLFPLLWILTLPALSTPALGFVLTPHYIVDGDLSFTKAMRASWRATHDSKGKLLLYMLAGNPILLLGVAAGGIGICGAVPAFATGIAYAYVRLSGRNQLPPYSNDFAVRSVRTLMRLALVVLLGGFVTAVGAVLRLPPVRGSAWSPEDAIIRVTAVLFGVGATVTLLAALLPWVLDGLEGRTFTSFVAARHVRSQKSGFLTVISILSIMGVAISSCALSSVVSVMGGFSQDLKRKILGNNAHIVIDTTSQKPWTDSDSVLERVRAVPGVVAATPVAQGEVMIASPSNLTGALVKGVDTETIGNVIDLKKNIEIGKFDYLVNPDLLRRLPPDEVIGVGPGGEEFHKGTDLSLLPDDIDPAVRAAIDPLPPLRPGLVIGRELSKTLHVYVGDDVTMVSPLGDLGPMGVMPRTKKFRIAAIFYTGMYEYDASYVYTTMEVAQEYFQMQGKISAIDVKVDDGERADQLTPTVTQAVGRADLRVRDWREMYKNLFSALKLERLATFVILSIAIMVASFCIICTLLLMVTEKGKEISILKALGASDGAILRTFMVEGVIIGGIGTAFGVITGLALCSGLASFGLRLDPDVYYIDRLPIHVSGWDFLAVATAAMVICTLSTIYPAFAASRLRPVDGLRYE